MKTTLPPNAALLHIRITAMDRLAAAEESVERVGRRASGAGRVSIVGSREFATARCGRRRNVHRRIGAVPAGARRRHADGAGARTLVFGHAREHLSSQRQTGAERVEHLVRQPRVAEDRPGDESRRNKTPVPFFSADVAKPLRGTIRKADDNGAGTYVYPVGPYPKGMFDLKTVNIQWDEETVDAIRLRR